MRLNWEILLPATTVSPLYNLPASATGAHVLKNVLLPYADRPDLPHHHVSEQTLRLSLKASVATRLDFYHEFIDVSRLLGLASGASGMYRRASNDLKEYRAA
jgi:hypothetical protein